MHARRVHSLILAVGLAIALLAIVFGAGGASRPEPLNRPPGEYNPQEKPALEIPTFAPSGSVFNIECADCPKQFDYSTDRLLRLDSQGKPHLAYGRDHLYYTWWDGAGWRYETADRSTLVGSAASLALTSSDSPRIAYLDTLNGKLKFAWRTASGWQSQTLDGAGYGTPSLAVDASGYAHISYWDGVHLKYAYQDAGGWHFELADSSPNTGQGTSLALDKNGYPHISYWDYGNDDLKYAYKDAGGWHQVTVDNVGNTGSDNSIALDDNDRVHISYNAGYPDYDLKYALGVGGVFTTTLVDTVNGVGAFNSIAVSHQGAPFISYQADDTLRYAALEGSTWQTATLDSGGLIGGFTSIAVDNSGQAHIAYYDLTVSDFGYKLKVINQSGAGWNDPVIVDYGSDVGGFTSLALDAQGYPHISYMDQTLQDLKYAYKDASGWHQQTLDWINVVGLCTSLALDRHGYPHISYYDWSNERLKYIYKDASGWKPPIILDGGATTGCYSSLALDSLGYAHISYYHSTFKSLRYAFQDASGWQYRTIDGVGNIGIDSSLALDANDIPHISYFALPGEDLRYATLQGGDWITQTVDADGEVGSNNHLALDADGKVYIAYSDDANRDLKIAIQNGNGWDIAVVDAFGGTGASPSIAIASDGSAHISYTGDLCPGPCGRLKYAENSSGVWITQTIPLDGYYYGFGSSIALHADQPRISFYDPSTGDLKYASLLTPLESLALSGASSGVPGVAYPFTAAVQPPNASLPITTTWQASQQETLVQVGGATQTVSYTWETPGVQVITVTAQNPASLISATHVITISDAPIVGLTASNNSPTIFGAPTAFSASVSGGSNVSYAWQFGDGETGVGAQTQHTYAAPGVYTATVTASNSLGQAQASTVVWVVYSVYLPQTPNGFD